MKSWLHGHRGRKSQSSVPLLSTQGPLPERGGDKDEQLPNTSSMPILLGRAAKLASSQTSSRMSIERYLSAPLEDEPASVPAITAALSRQPSLGPFPQVPRYGEHTGSLENNSEGRKTFYTSGSPPDSTHTSHTAASRKTSRSTLYQTRSQASLVIEGSKAKDTVRVDLRYSSRERPTTGGTLDAGQVWTDHLEDHVYTREATSIAHTATTHRATTSKLLTTVTDAEAYAQMARRPKLAWVLGGDVSDVRSIERPKSSGATPLGFAEETPLRPSTSGLLAESTHGKAPRKAKSAASLKAAASGRVPSLDPKTTKRPRLHCTFCQKRFHSQVEWMEHEQSVHMPKELWVCCPRTGDFPERCPFCARSRPSPSHLADHNYLSCQEKPLSERTFSSKDNFLQHISHEHKVSAWQKPLRFTELLEAWRHPLPLRNGFKALHCGFCGRTFATYKERSEHVARHFAEGLDMMSWWTRRVDHSIPNAAGHGHMNPDVPHRCCYCQRTYVNLAVAQKLHPTCTMWSCSFLPGMQYTIYPAGSRAKPKALCCYCNETLVEGTGKVSGSVLKTHLSQHNFRNCNQRLYFSAQRFRQHLQDNHKSNCDGTLFAGWTSLLSTSKQRKPAMYEQVDASLVIRRAFTDPGITMAGGTTAKDVVQLSKANFMDLSDTPPKMMPRKLQRKASSKTLSDQASAGSRNVGDSEQLLPRAATIDIASGNASLESHQVPQSSIHNSRNQPHQHKAGFPVSSLPTDAANACPQFYRRRLDVSTRNKLYVRDVEEQALSKNLQRLFRKVPGSVLGGLVLHSSLIGAVPARMTNSVDIYSLH